MSAIKYLIVGAGLFGAVMAERIANDIKQDVVVVERRRHVGGNVYSEIDKRTGIEYHKYGSHIFHTSNQRVWDYINRLTHFNNYRHKVLTTYKGSVYPMPVNLETINKFYRKNFTPSQAKDFIRHQIAIDTKDKAKPDNFEDAAISKMGKSLYDAFIRGYATKQWGMNLQLLPLDVAERLPMRYNYKTDYFDDFWQGIPVNGYTEMIQRMLDSERITVKLGVDFFDIKSSIQENTFVIYSGPIDRFYNYKYGRLGWRTLRFEFEVVNVADFQGTAVMNYADVEVPFTRIHEFRHLHDERAYNTGATIICKEYPQHWSGTEEPYYPLNTPRDQELLRKYQMEENKQVIFGGRLGSYKYLDMDDVIEQALDIYETKVKVL